MANELILDISRYDLDAVAVSAEEVGRLNPQCGAMRQLDFLAHLDLEGKRAIGVKDVREDEFWVPLHIPGRPLMPGVLMIEAAAQLASIYHKSKTKDDQRFLGFTRVEETSFRSQVDPGERLAIALEEIKFNPRRFVCRAQGFVGDRFIYETRISGMAL